MYYYELLHLFDVWQLLIQRHILHLTSMQFKVKCVFFSSRLQWSEYSSCRSKQKSWMLTLVKLRFQYTRRHVNKICFICAMYLVLHQVRNRPLRSDRCCYSELSLPVILLMSSWMRNLRAMKIEAHVQIANTMKPFTGCWTVLSWGFDVQTQNL